MNKKLQKLISQLKPEEAKPFSPDPFDWNAFFKSEPTEDEWKDARLRANKWPTCACGNQCSIIPRDKAWNDSPIDEKLFDLGFDFYQCIRNRNMKEAKAIFAKIEARSAVLIEEILKERNL